MSSYTQKKAVAYLEQAMLEQIKKYLPEEHRRIVAHFDESLLAARNIVATAGYAMVYHGLLEGYTDCDIIFTDTRFCQAFVQSDYLRALEEDTLPIRPALLYYAWYINGETMEVVSCRSDEIPDSHTVLTPVDFGHQLPMKVFNRIYNTGEVFHLDELYAQYSLLSKDFPEKVKYSKRKELVSEAILSRYARAFSPIYQLDENVQYEELTPPVGFTSVPTMDALFRKSFRLRKQW